MITQNYQFHNKSILITGGAGFIGSHLAKKLFDQGNKIIIIDNLEMGSKDNLNANYTFFESCINDHQLWKSKDLNSKLKTVDIVIHLAADVTVRDSLNSYQKGFQTNTLGTINTFENISRFKNIKQFIFASSMAVYGENPQQVPHSECHQASPLSPYGVSKLSSELYLRSMRQSTDIDITVLRLFNAFGDGQKFTTRVGLITILTNLLIKNKRPTLFGYGEQTRDFIHVDDIVKAFILAIENPKEFEIYNIGSGKGYKIKTIFENIKSTLNSDIQAQLVDSIDGELSFSVANIEKAKQELGFEIEDNFEVQLNNTVRSIIKTPNASTIGMN